MKEKTTAEKSLLAVIALSLICIVILLAIIGANNRRLAEHNALRSDYLITATDQDGAPVQGAAFSFKFAEEPEQKSLVTDAAGKITLNHHSDTCEISLPASGKWTAVNMELPITVNAEGCDLQLILKPVE